MKYLTEHVDAVLNAIRHSKELLTRGHAAWETTAWVRSLADAMSLSQTLREALFREVEHIEGATDVCVGVVRRTVAQAPPEMRWGVLVRLGRS